MGHSDEEVSAMEFVKGSMAGIEFEFPPGSEVEDVARHPMVYSRLYMQWEASWVRLLGRQTYYLHCFFTKKHLLKAELYWFFFNLK